MKTKMFRTAHTIITIDLDTNTVNYINKNDRSFNKIHIFVFNPDDIKINSLKIFAQAAKRRKNCKIIIHCFNAKDRFDLRKQLKGIKKGWWFHFNLMKSRQSMIFALSPNKFLQIGYGEVKEYERGCNWDEKILCNTFLYDTKTA